MVALHLEEEPVMRAFGLTSRHMRDCCPGHSDFPRETYRNRRDTKLYRRRERRILRHQLNVTVRKGDYSAN